MDVMRIRVLLRTLMRSGDNSLRSNLIRVTARIRLVIDHLTLDYRDSICPWII